MTFVMTGAPLAMVGCGFSPDEATLGISWHVMAMFAPSFFTGRLISYFGKERIVAFGLVLLLGCAAVALSGIALWQFWTSLILLGLGWNFGFIGATAMVAETYSDAEKGKVQGFHDFVLFGVVALRPRCCPARSTTIGAGRCSTGSSSRSSSSASPPLPRWRCARGV